MAMLSSSNPVRPHDSGSSIEASLETVTTSNLRPGARVRKHPHVPAPRGSTCDMANLVTLSQTPSLLTASHANRDRDRQDSRPSVGCFRCEAAKAHGGAIAAPPCEFQ